MHPKTQTTEPQENAITRVRDVMEADQRVVALWLEGSFAEEHRRQG